MSGMSWLSTAFAMFNNTECDCDDIYSEVCSSNLSAMSCRLVFSKTDGLQQRLKKSGNFYSYSIKVHFIKVSLLV